MPSTPDAIEAFVNAKIMYSPGKASNAGGVATSGLEMSQNSGRLSWTAEEVDAKLKGIMKAIHDNARAAAEKYGHKMDYKDGRQHRRLHEGRRRDARAGRRLRLPPPFKRGLFGNGFRRFLYRQRTDKQRGRISVRPSCSVSLLFCITIVSIWFTMDFDPHKKANKCEYIGEQVRISSVNIPLIRQSSI